MSFSVARVPGPPQVSRNSQCHQFRRTSARGLCARHCFKDAQHTVISRKKIFTHSTRGKFFVAASSDSSQTEKAQSKVTYDCVVVGAGISGLCTAHALINKHSSSCPNVLVTESRDRVGGNITSKNADGFLWEEGPNSFQPSDAMLSIAVDVGLGDDLVYGDPKAPRFVYWDKKLRPTPSGPDVLTFDLLSPWGKIRAGLGAFGLLNGTMPEGKEESVEQFVRRNLGDEVFERLIEPFCSGVYAGDPSKLSMKAAFGRVWELERNGGSIAGGAFKLIQERKKNPPPPRDSRLPPKPKGQTVGSFREGLKMLPEAIAKQFPDSIRLGWRLKAIAKEGEAYRLTYETPGGEATVRARSVALTCPAHVAADLLKGHCPEVARELSSFDYPPVGAVTVSYPLSAFREERFDEEGKIPGFGQLHPRSQGVTTLGTLYSSSLFPGRAPEGQQLLLNFIGGATNRGILDQSPEELVKQVDRDLREEGMPLKKDAPEPNVISVRVWPKAIPQFNVGHEETVRRAAEGLKEAGWPGVHLGGNYVCGVALGKCVEYASEYAEQIVGQVSEAVQKDKAVAK
uniref:Protoporphyrinogen oxidase n=1 Tax=Tetraselmis sp. GSL018 TaxID=582737 RepID=A0A061S6R9_9CHLO|eukprot:CAMPEP_0177596908 /NCGR_PEP_ID=MMETSP0419_2-20121207/11399_1 /TAXON_ID=582737 /ORGANISM="Tetraselmis sp., Strain GSL018" /LENGTH=569 /DNA_ID=CAMNT_0019088983 /DNA_START=68 /DNA_END=1777 /DNA_ORIENTATION=-